MLAPDSFAVGIDRAVGSTVHKLCLVLASVSLHLLTDFADDVAFLAELYDILQSADQPSSSSRN